MPCRSVQPGPTALRELLRVLHVTRVSTLLCQVGGYWLLCGCYVVVMWLLRGCYVVVMMLCGCYKVAMQSLCGCYVVVTVDCYSGANDITVFSFVSECDILHIIIITSIIQLKFTFKIHITQPEAS